MANNQTGGIGETSGQRKEIRGHNRDTEETPTRQGVSWTYRTEGR